MNSMYDDVAEFHRKVLQLEDAREPFLPHYAWLEERARFLQEELTEFIFAALASNLVDITDALLDTVYVALGTLHMMGIPVQQCWDAVQHANMQKVRGTTKRGNAIDAVKPEGWVGPEATIKKVIQDARESSYD